VGNRRILETLKLQAKDRKQAVKKLKKTEKPENYCVIGE
jgi:hypothetical protein